MEAVVVRRRPGMEATDDEDAVWNGERWRPHENLLSSRYVNNRSLI